MHCRQTDRRTALYIDTVSTEYGNISLDLIAMSFDWGAALERDSLRIIIRATSDNKISSLCHCLCVTLSPGCLFLCVTILQSVSIPQDSVMRSVTWALGLLLHFPKQSIWWSSS